MSKKLTAANYTKDKLYGPVSRALTELMNRQDVISPIDILLHLDRVSKEDVENWRFGRLPYLERAFLGSLGKASRILRILALHARSLKLVPSVTDYRRWGKGKKHIKLRFSKYEDANLERAYSTHYLVKSRISKKKDTAMEDGKEERTVDQPSRSAESTRS